VSAVGIRLERLSKRFGHRVKGEVHAAREVSLDVRPGEFLTLLGPSGCGKTTTLRMIAGFETPDTGRVWIGDDDVTEVAVNHRGIGFVFQNYALFPHLTVQENVAYGLRVQGRGQGEVDRAVAEVLELVGLRGYERQLPNQLSGGEQQRVALARAIVVRPRVLLFDEPLSNLDARLRVRMRDEIRALQQSLAITAVYVTHDQEEAMAVSDRIAVMNGGRIVQEGSAEDLYHRPRSEFVARFVGRVNLLSALVVAREGPRLTVEVAGRRLSLAAPGPPEPDLAPGTAVRLVVRPETVSLHALGPGGGSDAAEAGGLEGRVVSRIFLGEKVEYQVRVGDALLQVTRYGAGEADAVGPGRPVRLVLPEAGVALLPEAAE
jgi:iron(III) transport system ATP-binding protein